jgi:hypothetical protein
MLSVFEDDAWSHLGQADQLAKALARTPITQKYIQAANKQGHINPQRAHT